jgi:hypothetical protein
MRRVEAVSGEGDGDEDGTGDGDGDEEGEGDVEGEVGGICDDDAERGKEFKISKFQNSDDFGCWEPC